MGLSANAIGLDTWAMDPEALILFTVGVARRDPRLFDEMLDWLAVNHRLLSMQRLRNLNSRFSVNPSLVDATLASAVGHASRPRIHGESEQRREGTRVFSSDVLNFIGTPDPIFADYGYIRPRVILSGKSSPPDTRHPVNFAFQLRHLFGPGSRSEALRVLLTSREGPLDVAQISDEAGFAKRNMNDTLASLTASRTVKARWSGNERLFTLYRDKWATILEISPDAGKIPEFVSWIHLLSASLEIAQWLDSVSETTDSEYLVSSQARDLIEQVNPRLEVAGINIPSVREPRGAEFLPTFAATVECLLVALRAHSVS